MIRVSVAYPNGEDARFDHDYYAKTHFDMCVDLYTPYGLKGVGVDKGLAGPCDMPPPYIALGYVMFDTVEEFKNAFDAEGAGLLADVPNYTNVEPVITISEVYL